MPEITLTDDHRYFVDGKEYDGVTSVIREAGLIPSYSPIDLEWYLSRGQAIHLATELHDKGTLDESTLDPRITGYLESYKKLNLNYEPEDIEIRLVDSVYLVGGTLDRIDSDLKSGTEQPWHLIQSSIYWKLKCLNSLNKSLMKTFYLKEDGSYPTVREYTMRELLHGASIFYAALGIVRWKRENKIK